MAVRLSKIYTKTGDDGTTGLADGTRVEKCCDLVSAYGSVDELNALMGFVATEATKWENKDFSVQIEKIQNLLFDIGAYLATPSLHKEGQPCPIEEEDIGDLEKMIDDIVKGMPPLKSFVLPGGSEANCRIHIARAVCRRAERDICNAAKERVIHPNIIAYVNRLSDYLFALARYEAKMSGRKEKLWKPVKKP